MPDADAAHACWPALCVGDCGLPTTSHNSCIWACNLPRCKALNFGVWGALHAADGDLHLNIQAPDPHPSMAPVARRRPVHMCMILRGQRALQVYTVEQEGLRRPRRRRGDIRPRAHRKHHRTLIVLFSEAHKLLFERLLFRYVYHKEARPAFLLRGRRGCSQRTNLSVRAQRRGPCTWTARQNQQLQGPLLCGACLVPPPPLRRAMLRCAALCSIRAAAAAVLIGVRHPQSRGADFIGARRCRAARRQLANKGREGTLSSTAACCLVPWAAPGAAAAAAAPFGSHTRPRRQLRQPLSTCPPCGRPPAAQCCCPRAPAWPQGLVARRPARRLVRLPPAPTPRPPAPLPSPPFPLLRPTR